MVDTFRPLELGEGGRAARTPLRLELVRPGPRGRMTAIDVPDGSLFGLDNLPYGVFSAAGDAPRVGRARRRHTSSTWPPRSAPTGPTPRSPRRR